MRGESSVSYSISVNGDVESFIDSLAPDDGQFESMVKRTVLLLTAPVVIPTIPMQNLQSAIFNKRLSRRNTATADYETEAAFTVSTPSETKTLRLAEEFRISRKNSFDSKLELTNDWESLADILGRVILDFVTKMYHFLRLWRHYDVRSRSLDQHDSCRMTQSRE